jgi:hypothetical protein
MNEQTRETFEAEAAAIEERTLYLKWVAPSRAEEATGTRPVAEGRMVSP